MSDDWIDKLEKDFSHIVRGHEDESREKLVERLMDLFFGVWLRFDLDRGVRMQLTPFEWDFVEYKGHKDWKLDENFNFKAVTDIELLDTRFPHKQGLRAELYTAEGKTRLRLVYELADWMEKGRRGTTPYLLYDAPLEAVRAGDAWKEMRKVLIPWNGAHIRGDQEMFWDWIKSNYIELPRR